MAYETEDPWLKLKCCTHAFSPPPTDTGNPKHEIRNSKQIQTLIFKFKNFGHLHFGSSDLFRASIFEFRIFPAFIRSTIKRRFLLAFSCRVNLGEQLFVGKVLQPDRPGGTLRVAETVSFTENGVNDSLFPLTGLAKLDGAIRAG